MQLQTGNLFDFEGERGGDERIDVLVTGQRLNVERIVSIGHASAEGFWYDDSRAEWVVLLSGAAVLEFEVGPTLHDMRPGDFVLIESALPASRRVDAYRSANRLACDLLRKLNRSARAFLLNGARTTTAPIPRPKSRCM